MPPTPNYDLPGGPEKAEFRSAHNAGFQFGQTQAEIKFIASEDGGEDGIHFAFIGGQAVSLKQFMPPRHGKMSPSFFDPSSLIAYVNKYKEEDTLIFAEFDVRSGAFTVVFDYPAKGAVSRKEHVATFSVKPTEAWRDLLAINGNALDQEDFLEYIDKYRGIFRDPRGAEMLDIARYISGKSEGKFSFGKRLQTGDREVIWLEETQLRAGASAAAGEATAIPEQIEVELTMFEGTDPVTIKAWLRVYVKNGSISFKLEIQNLDDTVRAALDTVRLRIRNETDLPVLLGSPGVNAANN